MARSMILLLVAALTMCSYAHTLRAHSNHRHAAYARRRPHRKANAAAISMRFLSLTGDKIEVKSQEIIKEEQVKAWASAMITKANGCMGKLRDSMIETISRMCKDPKALAILQSIETPTSSFTEGQQTNAVLNVVVFYNLMYNGDAVYALAQPIMHPNEGNIPFTEMKISNAFSGYAVHPQNYKDKAALIGAFRISVQLLEHLHEKAPDMIIEVFKDGPLNGPCYGARFHGLNTALEELANTNAKGLFARHTDDSPEILQWVDAKLHTMFPDKDMDTLKPADVKKMFADPTVQSETGVDAASPRVELIIANLIACFSITA